MTQTTPAPPPAPSLDRLREAAPYLSRWLATQVETRHAPGAQVAVRLGDELVLSAAFGVADEATGAELTTGHLFRVATGLDSMVLGEPQILGQVKDAWAVARAHGVVDHVLVVRVGQEGVAGAEVDRGHAQLGEPRHVRPPVLGLGLSPDGGDERGGGRPVQTGAGGGTKPRPADEPGDLGPLIRGEVNAPGPDGAEQTQLAETVDVREFPANRGPDFARPRRR